MWIEKESQAVDYFNEQQSSENGLSAETSKNKKTENIAHKNRQQQGAIFIYVLVTFFETS